MLSYCSKRSSRRHAGLPPVDIYADLPDLVPMPGDDPKSEVFQLLASDTKGGRARMAEPGTGWNLHASSSSSVSSVSSSSTTPAKRSFPSDAKSPAKSSNSCDDSEETPKKKPPPNSNINEGLKLIPFLKLKNLVAGSCKCRSCGSDLLLTQETHGIATNIFLTCVPCDKRKKAHKQTIESPKLVAEPASEDGRKNRFQGSRIQDYLMNSLLVLGMHQVGLSGVETFLGMLGMRKLIGNHYSWKEVQDNIGRAEQAVKDEVLQDNRDWAVMIAKNAGAVPNPEAEGRVPLVCSLDGGWQKRSSGNSYDRYVYVLRNSNDF